MPDQVIVDCSLTGGLDAEARTRMEQEALELLKKGKTEEAQALLAELATALEQGADVSIVPMTVEEEAAHEADQAEAQAATAEGEAQSGRETEMREAIQAQLVKLVEAADKVASGTATAVQQRDALALSLRTTARLARIVLRELDESV
jgi:hypothetical protein